MTTKADYTEEEWETLVEGPKNAAAGVVVADMTVTSLVKEMIAIAKATGEAAEKFTATEMVREVAAEVKTRADAVADQAEKGETPKKPKLTTDQAIADIYGVISVLMSKAAPDERVEYKEMLIWYAETIAAASGEGFLGTGEKVSEDEAAFLDSMKTALAAVM